MKLITFLCSDNRPDNLTNISQLFKYNREKCLVKIIIIIIRYTHSKYNQSGLNSVKECHSTFQHKNMSERLRVRVQTPIDGRERTISMFNFSVLLSRIIR